jgi:hypothetical protein
MSLSGLDLFGCLPGFSIVEQLMLDRAPHLVRSAPNEITEETVLSVSGCAAVLPQPISKIDPEILICTSYMPQVPAPAREGISESAHCAPANLTGPRAGTPRFAYPTSLIGVGARDNCRIKSGDGHTGEARDG